MGRKHHGHKTLVDGSRVALSEGEAAALWSAIEASNKRRAEALPTATDALRALIDAQQRLQELGWWKGGGLRIKPGDECAVAEAGSTGMWSGRLDLDSKYVHFGDCVRTPRDVWLKPLADLTEEEQSRMEECDRREAEAFSADMDRLAALQERS